MAFGDVPRYIFDGIAQYPSTPRRFLGFSATRKLSGRHSLCIRYFPGRQEYHFFVLYMPRWRCWSNRLFLSNHASVGNSAFQRILLYDYQIRLGKRLLSAPYMSVCAPDTLSGSLIIILIVVYRWPIVSIRSCTAPACYENVHLHQANSLVELIDSVWADQRQSQVIVCCGY